MIIEQHFLFLIDRLAVHHPLSVQLIESLRLMVRERFFPREQFLLAEGEQQTVIWFIVKGYAREVCTSDVLIQGMTSWFWFEGDIIFQNGLFAGTPSLVDIEVYRDTVILEMAYCDILTLSEDFQELRFIGEQLRFQDYSQRKTHVSDLVNLKRNDHIHKVFHAHKRLFNVALHKDLASYFGVKGHGLYRYLKNLR